MTHSIVRLLAAGIAALALVAAVVPAAAGSYDERTGDAYRSGGEPLPWNGSTKDGYPVPQPPPHQSYKDDAPPPRVPRRAAQCLSKFGIRGALNEQGWHLFENVEIRGDIAYMTAQNDRGRRFDLQVDSCTGDVIDAHPIVVYYETPAPRPYYYAPRPEVGVYFYGGGGHRHWR